MSGVGIAKFVNLKPVRFKSIVRFAGVWSSESFLETFSKYLKSVHLNLSLKITLNCYLLIRFFKIVATQRVNIVQSFRLHGQLVFRLECQ